MLTIKSSIVKRLSLFFGCLLIKGAEIENWFYAVREFFVGATFRIVPLIDEVDQQSLNHSLVSSIRYRFRLFQLSRMQQCLEILQAMCDNLQL